VGRRMLARDPPAREQTAPLADPAPLDPRLGQAVEQRGADGRDREVPAVRRPLVGAGVPVNGRAITLLTACSPTSSSRATSHARYSSSSGTVSACAATWKTESAEV